MPLYDILCTSCLRYYASPAYIAMLLRNSLQVQEQHARYGVILGVGARRSACFTICRIGTSNSCGPSRAAAITKLSVWKLSVKRFLVGNNC